jgi:hypothetical protein
MSGGATIAGQPHFGATVAEPVERYPSDKISPLQVSAGIPLGVAFGDLHAVLSSAHGTAVLIAQTDGIEEVPAAAHWALVHQIEVASAFVLAMHRGYNIACQHLARPNGV